MVVSSAMALSMVLKEAARERLWRTTGLGGAVAMSEKGDDLRDFGEGAEGHDGALFIVGRMSRRLESAQGGVGDLEDGGGEGRNQRSYV